MPLHGWAKEWSLTCVPCCDDARARRNGCATQHACAILTETVARSSIEA